MKTNYRNKQMYEKSLYSNLIIIGVTSEFYKDYDDRGGKRM